MRALTCELAVAEVQVLQWQDAPWLRQATCARNNEAFQAAAYAIALRGVFPW